MLSLHSVVVERAGRSLFAPLNFNFGPLRYGLVGSSGSGKTSLARLLCGIDTPDSGQVLHTGRVRLFPQFETRPEMSVDDYLSGLWLTGAPANPLWRRWLQGVSLAAPLGQLSGGEWMRVRLLRLLDDSSCFYVLDEPSNHLDADGKAAVAGFLRQHEGGLILISHDRGLLREVDEIVELTPQGLQRFGGSFDFYWEQRSLQRARQEENLEDAKRRKRLFEREAREAVESQQKRMQEAKRRTPNAGIPKVVAGGLRRRAEVTLGRLGRRGLDAVVAAEVVRLQALEQRQSDPFVRLDFSSSAPPAGAVFACARGLQLYFPGSVRGLWSRPLDFAFSGRERWRLSGPNGSGKSSLLRLLLGDRFGRLEGSLRLSERPLVCLDQNQSLLLPDQSILSALLPASRFGEVALRNELAFYGFSAGKVNQPMGTLSGGERLRAALAVAFLGRCVPEWILLDEPTNNLDFQSQQLLGDALRRFEGLLVVASHDEDFVQGLNLDRELVL